MGERLDNDIMHAGGLVAFVAGGVAIGLMNTRKKPEAPAVSEDIVPVKITRL